jgi:dienelactone hydrolase
MSTDVFISYSNKDKSTADAVCSIMEQNGIRCWIAPRDITPGLPFAEAIIDGIKGSRVFVLIYSSNTNDSSQVIKEVDRAVQYKLAIIPLRLEDVPMTKQLEYYVSNVHWMDALTPPLEKHIEKLCRVVKILLTMETLGNENIRDAFETGQGSDSIREIRKRKKVLKNVMIAAAVIVLSVAGGWIYSSVKKQSKIRWAREVAIPQVIKMTKENDVWRNLVAPYRLAAEAEKILGEDTILKQLFRKCAVYIDVITDPPGAEVYIKEYAGTDTTWTFLGVTPIDSFRVPIGIFRWKFEKEGHDTLFAVASTWKPGGVPDLITGGDIFRKLDLKDSLPRGMVRVLSTETEAGRLNDFFIGKYEVTNREFKQFIDAGGYGDRKFWKHEFRKGDKIISWEEAMKTLVDQTGRPGPATWTGSDYPGGQGDFPVSGVSWYEAAAYAEWKGMTLPTSLHWNVARGGMTPVIQAPQLGGFGIFAPFTNFSGRGTVAVGSLGGLTAFGAYDMPGNVREWCWNETKVGRVIRGGSFQDNTYEFENERHAPSFDRSPGNGFRLAYYPDITGLPGSLFSLRTPYFGIDFKLEKPVSEEVFRIYKEQFAYDRKELNPVIEKRDRNPEGWIHELISFDAAYGNERMLAHLFLPEGKEPPFQTVIYFPGSASTWFPTSEGIEDYYEFTMFLSFLMRSGRAVMYPVYKGTFERSNPETMTLLNDPAQSNTYGYTEITVQEIKDFSRSIDYLQSREDIDGQKLAYMGMSWGGNMGAIIPAVEDRLDASVLIAGGLFGIGRPEIYDCNYVGRVRVPTLMLNGKYDAILPPDLSQRPMFELLGTPTEDKKHLLFETDHIPPRIEYIKETLTWLDKYLGPVK